VPVYLEGSRTGAGGKPVLDFSGDSATGHRQ